MNKDYWKIVGTIILVIFSFMILLGQLNKMRTEMIPPESPWAKTTPIDPVIPIISMIVAFILLRRREGE